MIDIIKGKAHALSCKTCMHNVLLLCKCKLSDMWRLCRSRRVACAFGYMQCPLCCRCAQEKGKSGANRIFYLSIPPSIFTAVAGAASKAASAPQVGKP